MTRRHASTAAALLLLIAAFGLLAALLMPAPAADAAQERPVPAAPAVTAPAAPDAFLAALVGPGTGLPENAGELLLAADRVCEGITAQVPAADMVAALTAEPLPGMAVPLTEAEAAHLVSTATATHCGLSVI